MMRSLLSRFTLGTILTVVTVATISDAEMRPRKEKAVGTVIAYDVPISGLAMLTSVPMEQLLIVRIDRPMNRNQETRYIKVAYRRWFNEPELPTGVLDGRGKWRFAVTRDRSCDGSVGELRSIKSKTEDGKEVILQRLRQTSGAEKEELPDDRILPCYLLRPGDLRPDR